jgi:hypothetical protein
LAAEQILSAAVPFVLTRPKSRNAIFSECYDFVAMFNDSNACVQDDPLLWLAGSGKDLWAEEHADDYIERLRQDPEGAS